MAKGKRGKHSFLSNRPLRWIVPISLLLAVALLEGMAPGWLDRLEGWTIDTRFALRGPQKPENPIIIVALDEASFQMLGDLHGENIRTWPRARWAELVDKIAAGGPRLIGLDVVFDTPGWDPGGDEALAAALARAGNVILASTVEASSNYQTITFGQPIEALRQAALGVGVASFPIDADGVFRRAGLLWSSGEATLPSQPLALSTAYLGQAVTVDQSNLAGGTSVYIHFCGPEGAFRTIPMYQVWNGEIPAGIFQGAIVMVGYTTLLEQDRHPTPFGGKLGLPGVELQANAIDTLLSGAWLRHPPGWLALVLLASAGLLALLAANLPRPLMGVTLMLGFGALYTLLGLILFNRYNYLLPLSAPAIAALATGGAALTERMIFAEQDKRRLRQRFGGMMSAERLQAVMGNWEALRNAERPMKDAAVLFADVRGFTRATEKLMRQGRNSEMTRFLSAYLDAMSAAILQEGGVVYRVFGDGLLVMFGMPESLPDYALHAVKATVRMALASEALQALWPLRQEEALCMGIGLHCGPMIDAIVGSGKRLDYAIIGDPANTAARIEAHCKVAMELPRPPGGEVPANVTILISQAIYQQVQEHVLVDESIPPFEARGKAAPVQVYRLLGMKKEF